MSETQDISFKNPPVVEFALGVQFSPLAKFTSGHFGLFWQELGISEWKYPADAPLIQDQFESFERPRWTASQNIEIQFELAPAVGRFALRHQNGDKQIQVQPTRFQLHWKKTDSFKPSYGALIEEFQATFYQFLQFVERYNVGPVIPNQWEVTYVDSFQRGKYWDTPSDWAQFLPGLFGELFEASKIGIILEHRAAEWSFEIQPQKARLHISAGPGKWGQDENDSLILTTTARGPLRSADAKEVRAGLDLGHEKAVQSFLQLVDEKTKTQWGMNHA